MAKRRPYDQDCPIARTLDIVGDRWTLLIVRDLFIGQTRFNEFLDSSPRMPPKVLSDRLKKLLEHGFIERQVYSEHPLRAEYHLTETGLSFRPVLHAMGEWGFEHLFEGEEELRDKVREIVAERLPEYRRSLQLHLDERSLYGSTEADQAEEALRLSRDHEQVRLPERHVLEGHREQVGEHPRGVSRFRHHHRHIDD